MNLKSFIDSLDETELSEMARLIKLRQESIKNAEWLTYVERRLILDGNKVAAIISVRKRLELGWTAAKDLCDNFIHNVK